MRSRIELQPRVHAGGSPASPPNVAVVAEELGNNMLTVEAFLEAKRARAKIARIKREAVSQDSAEELENEMMDWGLFL